MTAAVQLVTATGHIAVVEAAGAAADADACTDADANVVAATPTAVVVGVARVRDVVDLLGRSYRVAVLVVALRCLHPPQSMPVADRVRPSRCVHKGRAVHNSDIYRFRHPQLTWLALILV